MSERLHIRTIAPRGEPGEGAVAIRDPDVVGGYLRDASQRIGSAEALFRPRTECDVARIVASAQREGVPLTVVAGQTSTTGSSVADSGWLLSTEHLDGMAVVDRDRRLATCGAGMNLGALVRAVEADGLFYPPDPTSRDDCTVGGAVACNASGARSHRFGPTRAWVRRVRVVLPCGEVIEIARGASKVDARSGFVIEHGEGCAFGRAGPREIPIPDFAFASDVKNATGLFGGEEIDPIDLFIGSEGILGVLTEVEVALRLRRGDPLNLFVSFASEGDALDFVDAVCRASRGDGPIRADAIEWFDRASLALIAEDGAQVPVVGQAEAAVYVEQLPERGEPREAEEMLENWSAWLEFTGIGVGAVSSVRVARSESEREALRRARHAVPAGINERAAQRGMPKLATDLAVGDERLREVMALYRTARDRPRSLLAASERDALPERVASVTFGHVGDNHLHMNFLPRTPQERELAEGVKEALTRRVIEWGGSPSAEHGIGKLKRAALRQRVGESAYARMRATRRAFDPKEILGRGNLFESDDAPLS